MVAQPPSTAHAMSFLSLCRARFGVVALALSISVALAGRTRAFEPRALSGGVSMVGIW
jgi:hypothetical protein